MNLKTKAVSLVLQMQWGVYAGSNVRIGNTLYFSGGGGGQGKWKNGWPYLLSIDLCPECPEPESTSEPTPESTPEPTPATSGLEITYETVGLGLRCHPKYRATGKWGDLGAGLDAANCQAACSASETCKYV